ncbi:hypothetical protein [Campylobacter sp. US33a]|uniref:hypothetical protein n=1 Tax=Campylobacter sp. US33a TaxID=2498120 RepID=UPI00106854B8|nr:hypothetical protein [Campylobacter sp. US33a]TEY00360.1 hypothetical protein ELQ16_09260 [Campylobacter sp. US33a]
MIISSVEEYNEFKALADDIKQIRDRYDGAFENIDNKSKQAIQEFSNLSNESLKIIQEQTQMAIEKVNEAVEVIDRGAEYKVGADPTDDVNPLKVGVTWVNTTTGEIFICIDNTENANVWLNKSKLDLESVEQALDERLTKVEKSSGAFTFVQSEAPAEAKVNDIWFKTSTGEIFIYRAYEVPNEENPPSEEETQGKEESEEEVKIEYRWESLTDTKLDIKTFNEQIVNYLHLEKDAILKGLINFSQLPTCSQNPTQNNQFTNKIYVDGKEKGLNTKITNLTNTVNKKENSGVAKQLVDALRTELKEEINKNTSSPNVLRTALKAGSGRGRNTYEFYLNGVLQSGAAVSDTYPYTSMGNNS